MGYFVKCKMCSSIHTPSVPILCFAGRGDGLLDPLRSVLISALSCVPRNTSTRHFWLGLVLSNISHKKASVSCMIFPLIKPFLNFEKFLCFVYQCDTSGTPPTLLWAVQPSMCQKYIAFCTSTNAGAIEYLHREAFVLRSINLLVYMVDSNLCES